MFNSSNNQMMSLVLLVRTFGIGSFSVPRLRPHSSSMKEEGFEVFPRWALLPSCYTVFVTWTECPLRGQASFGKQRQAKTTHTRPFRILTYISPCFQCSEDALLHRARGPSPSDGIYPRSEHPSPTHFLFFLSGSPLSSLKFTESLAWAHSTPPYHTFLRATSFPP